jgi:hypothetical protein
MRIHIENLTSKVEEHDNFVDDLKAQYDDEISTLKREKRRLDDLMTIRETEIESLRAFKLKAEAEMKGQIENLERKYERSLTRVKEEFLKQSHPNNSRAQPFYGSATIDLNSLLVKQGSRHSHSQDRAMPASSTSTSKSKAKGRSNTAQGFVGDTKPLFTSFQQERPIDPQL